MSSVVLSQSLDGVNTAVFNQGRIFNILSAPGGPVNVTLDRRSPNGGQTQNRQFNGIPAGSKYIADRGDEWTYLKVFSPVAQLLQIFVGDEDLSFNNAVSVTGTAITAVLPASVIADTVPVVCAATAVTAVVPQNLSRRRVTLSSDPAAGATVWIRKAGGANNLIPLQPGTYIELDGTYAVSVQNPSAGAITVYVFEET